MSISNDGGNFDILTDDAPEYYLRSYEGDWFLVPDHFIERYNELMCNDPDPDDYNFWDDNIADNIIMIENPYRLVIKEFRIK